MKGFWTDFKKFISKGNIMDLALAVIIGTAFGKIVTSLVNDVIMPLISAVTGGVSISDWKWIITPGNPAMGIAESSLNYGTFIQAILDFLIIAFFIFLAVRVYQKSKKKLEEVSKDIKYEIKKKKRRKGESVFEEVINKENVEGQNKIDISSENKELVTTEKSEDNKNEIISSMTQLVKSNEQASKSQEKILREIRDLLKQKDSTISE